MMENFLEIVNEAILKQATDIHLIEKMVPVYRIHKKLEKEMKFEPMDRYILEGLLQTLIGDNLGLMEEFEVTKVLNIPLEISEKIRLRINISISDAVPTYAIRIIRNQKIDIEKYNLKKIVEMIKTYNSGLILITGRVGTGKTTTLNAVVQEINKELNKKIVMLEEPIEYKHNSKCSIVIQKEVNASADINSYYDGVINLLREDSDIAVVGEIRDRKTMDAVIDLAQSGGLVIGTLHTRSCAETIERIICMYNPSEQKAIKYSLSTILKMVISQKLVTTVNKDVTLVSEIMVCNPVIAALIRQESFSMSDIQDAIQMGSEDGMITFEKSFANLFNKGIIDEKTIEKNTEPESLKIIYKLLGGNV